jgi:signal peptidase I
MFIVYATLVLTIAGYLVIRRLFWVADVHGESMMPAFYPGDKLLVLRVWPRKMLVRGIPVIVDHSLQQRIKLGLNSDTAYLVKRVVGLPEDCLWINNEGVSLLGDGEMSNPTRDEDGKRVRLSCSEVFVVGDSPTGSLDSRTLGPLQMDSIKGLVVTRLHSPKRASGLEQR